MSKITNGFIILLLAISFSSVLYIWQSDTEKKELESKIASAEEQIGVLENQLEQKDTPADEITTGEVQGATTSTGILSGTVNISKDLESEAIVVCANQVNTKQESCVDIIITPQQKSYNFEFELPQGKYEVYAITPPQETKIYYSEISTCKEDGDCSSNEKQKRLLEIVQDETQSNIDINL